MKWPVALFRKFPIPGPEDFAINVVLRKDDILGAAAALINSGAAADGHVVGPDVGRDQNHAQPEIFAGTGSRHCPGSGGVETDARPGVAGRPGDARTARHIRNGSARVQTVIAGSCCVLRSRQRRARPDIAGSVACAKVHQIAAAVGHKNIGVVARAADQHLAGGARCGRHVPGRGQGKREGAGVVAGDCAQGQTGRAGNSRRHRDGARALIQGQAIDRLRVRAGGRANQTRPSRRPASANYPCL